MPASPQPGRAAIRMTAVDAAARDDRAAERIAQAAGLDVGGVEVVIDDRDGTPRFYDINALSNFVADPLDVLGWDPHDRLGRLPRSRDRKAGRRHEVRLLDAGVRRLAAQHPRRGDGGELGLCAAG